MKKLKIFCLILLLLAAVWAFSTFALRVDKATVQSEQISEPVTIVQLSDLHGYSFGPDNRWLLWLVERQQPDLIAVTGDMYTAGRDSGTASRLISTLTDIAPVYYVNGEHDNSEGFKAELSAAGVRVMDYADELLTVGDTTLHLYGINNVYYSDTFHLDNDFTEDSEHFSLLLAHIPNFEKFRAFGIDLALCGDTHGGQIRLPGLGALYDGSTWLPERSGIPMKGLYEQDGNYLYISSGLGNYPVPVRFCNRPEVSVIRLEPKR